MFKKILTTTTLASLMAFSASSFAATTPVNNNGTFVGVNGIDIDGVTYNVSWSLSQKSLPLKWYNKTFAQKASSALSKTLYSHKYETSWSFQENGKHRFENQWSSWAVIHTYWLNDSDATAVNPDDSYSAGVSIWTFQTDATKYENDILDYSYLDSPSDELYDDDYVTTWTAVSAVPIPSAALMFAPALLGFAALRRKKRA